jgi:tRNA (guanine37-N1)-methyltransferase
MMKIHVFTIFPDLFDLPLGLGILGRAQKSGLVQIEMHDLRSFSKDPHKTVDDAPFGGGPGMVMKAEPFFDGIESLDLPSTAPRILLSPQGKTFTQGDAERLSKEPVLSLLCGRYEGVDERVAEFLASEVVSIGDFVLSGGEFPCMTIIDAIVRLLPNALGHGETAILDDSYSSGLIQYPQFTRPAQFRSWTIPEVLLSGNHEAIKRWRRKQALLRTLERRPDLLMQADLSQKDKDELRALGWEG